MRNLISITHIKVSALISLFCILLSCQNDIAVRATPMSTSFAPNSSPVWTDGAGMTTPRTDFTGTVLDQKVYIIEGFDEKGNTTDVIEFYDPKENKWSSAPSLPEPLDHAAAATYQNKIYVVGG